MEQEIEQFEKIYTMVAAYLVEYSFQVFAALVIFLLGLWVANKSSGLVFKLMKSRNIDITLTTFAANLVKALMITMFVVISLGKVGISVTPFVAAIGAASLGAGLALQGMLSNYGAGLAIIATRPFVVGDTIKVNGVLGQVKSIELGKTLLTNEDQVEISVPNKQIVGEVIYNSFAYSLVDSSIGIAYDADYEKAIALIAEVLAQEATVTKEPEPLIGIDEFADSSVTVRYRYYADTQHLHKTKFAVNQAIFAKMQEHGIAIPFPQRVVHLHQA